MSGLAVSPLYSALLVRIPPRVIRSDEQNEAYIQALYELEQHQAAWSPEEADLADLLTLLIEDYEEKHFELPASSPRELIEFLMEQHGLRQKDLVDVFGTPSIVSEVLSGKRDLTRQHMRRLGKRFNVPPELFF
jgi:HTH-type transcriptional regulator / antitoxin HigA